MSPDLKHVTKLSHKQFRVLLKKFRRKKKRQQLAKERENKELLDQQHRENSPNYKEREIERLRNAELFDQFEERERTRKHKQWLMREQKAQIEFKKKQEQLEIEKIKQEEERKRILAEFERQQFVEAKAAEESQKLKSEKEVIYAEITLNWQSSEVLQKTLANLPQGDENWHNPFAPAASNGGPDHSHVGQEREQCQFFTKTGCCKFGDSCSRGHVYPAVSCTILICGMYSHFSIGQTGRDDFDTDDILEYEDSERYQDFKNFYNDVLPEFKKYGKVVQFKVCSNHESHLRGNVYVQFESEENAVEAYKNFNGRYYAGRQMSCQFTHIIKWKSAICGLFFRKMCPKGIHCNFLHTFRNPTDEFWEADRDIPSSVRSSYSSRSGYSSHRSQREYSSERRRRHRDDTPEYRSSYRSHSRRHSDSTDSNSDEYSSSSRHRRSDRRESSSRSRGKYERRDSKSDSHSPSSSEVVKKHKKKKHKKEKKSKKSKKDKISDHK